MTDDTQKSLAGAVNPILSLPPLKHCFESPAWIPAGKSKSGRDQTERTCKVCGAVKVTLHGDDIGRAWRASADAPQVETFEAPVCIPMKSNVTSEKTS